MGAERAESTRLVLKALAKAWEGLNCSHFADSMQPPVFTLMRGKRLLGRWRSSLRELAIQEAFIFSQSWGQVLEVLKHEMAHQYVDEILRIYDERAHGPSFTRVCEERGIDAAPSGMPAAVEESRVMTRVQKLLALAESEDRREAEAAARRAQALMLKHNLRPGQEPAQYSFRHLGVPKGRIYEHSRWLAAVLITHFFVEGIWVPVFDAKRGVQGQVFEISGRPENLEIASYVWSFLSDTADRLWLAHKRKNWLTNKPRRQYLAGVMRGFMDKLNEEKAVQEERGLVWVGDSDLERYQAKRHPRTRTVRRGGEQRNMNYYAGVRDGGEIVLHRGVTHSSGSQGRLLGAGR